MSTLTIPKTLAGKDDLVVIPRKEYETLVRTAKANLAKAKPAKSGKKLPAGLRQALREVEAGKLSGPFSTVKEFMADLRR